MALGVAAGIALGERAGALRPLGDLFIRLLLMAAVPLIFFNLLAALAGVSEVRALGRLGGKTVVYFLATSVVALMLGLAAMEVVRPGAGVTLTEEVPGAVGEVPSLGDLLLDLVPANVFAAFSQGKVAQIVVFALFLGAATLLLPEPSRGRLQGAFEALAELLRKLVDVILIVAPPCLGALAAATVGQHGAGLFGPMALFLGGVWGAQAAMVVVYMALLWGFARRSPLDFLRRTGPLYATTAGTCSSLASMVVSFEMAEKRLGLPKHVYTFTLPLGAQLNIDGTSIMLAGVLMFTAQAAGASFSPAAQLTVVLVGLILTLGASGIPGGGLVLALIYVQAFHLPLEIAAIVGGIYRLVDMGNTTVNCMGDLVGTVIIAGTEPELPPADGEG